MATPSPTSSPPSDSNPNSAATPPHQTQQQQPKNPSSPPPADITVVALAATTSSVARKTQPVLWTHDETFLLIESFKEKWHAIGRGPLKSNHWEEIAVAVSARSGVDRSATQCRHKIEKLRKRFRSERQSMGPISIWPFYNQMEEMDSSPAPISAPISARPLTRLPPNSNNHYQDDEGEDQEEEEAEDNYEEEEEDERQSKSRSINYILRRPGAVNRFAGVSEGLLSCGQRERSMKTKRNNDGDGGGERRRKGARAVAAEIRTFAERIMVMEKKKMEFVKETVRLRKEMEIRRINLIQSSQTQLLQFLNSSFDSCF